MYLSDCFLVCVFCQLEEQTLLTERQDTAELKEFIIELEQKVPMGVGRGGEGCPPSHRGRGL